MYSISIQMIFLNYNNIYAQVLVVLARNGRRFPGKGLLKRNIKRRRYIIYISTNQIWNRISAQRNTLAENSNLINQDLMTRMTNNNNNTLLDRISQITIPQETNNTFEDNFFNGTSFADNNDRQDPLLCSFECCITIDAFSGAYEKRSCKCPMFYGLAFQQFIFKIYALLLREAAAQKYRDLEKEEWSKLLKI
ncbi:16510_t:CDS:2 [Funneliformis caledonium]|uniref:16510_t:CDS:1 n=1 Tax=Funneliformis caledonium TaxID=1117310 RepID=A0A9N8YNU6_9GLOM|nr:16510_t:CDS:2 [Funneliformis caledonium]